MQSLEIEKSFSSEYCNWPELINIGFSDDLKNKIDETRNLLKENTSIRHISIETPTRFLQDQSESEIQKNCKYDVNYITIGRTFVCYYIQGKYDAHIQAEYIIQ